MQLSAFDITAMRTAIRLGERGLGQCGENPSVGCVITKDQRIISHGWTQRGGRPHAETMALQRAGTHAHGATAYVTLEPCAHYGHTPPCAQALIDANIAHVVIGCIDPDTRVSGKGVAMLRAAHVTVTTGALANEALKLQYGFLRRVYHGLPDITVKIATSANGYITTGHANTPWITGPQARSLGHVLRARHDAIVTGSGTIINDDASLTCRLPGMYHASPVRIICDRRLRTPSIALCLRHSDTIPTWIITSHDQCNTPHAAALRAAGATIITTSPNATFSDIMQLLAQRGINRALIEGGQHLTHSALSSGISTQLAWFSSPHAIAHENALPALPAPATLDGFISTSPRIKQLCAHDQLHIYDLAHTQHITEESICSPASSAP